MRLLAAMCVGVILGVLLVPRLSSSHWQPGRHNAIHAIQLSFGPDWRDAVNVSHCEAGAYHWQRTGRPQDSGNGQYLGLFQMGRWARATFGHGPGVWAQAKAAAANFRSNGRSWRGQWECQPWWNPMPLWLLHRLGFR
jgi:hypothetical protein